jgi:predicted nuclease with TOPRIM domain
MSRNAALESDIKRLREHLRDYVETEDTLTENLDESRGEIEKLKNKVAELENIIGAQNHVKELEREVRRLRVASTNLLALHLRALEGDVAEQITWDDAIFRLHTSLVGLPE